MLAAARQQASVAAKAVQSLTVTHAKAQTELAAAEADVKRAAERIIDAEKSIKLAEFETAVKQLTALAHWIATSVPDGFNRRPGQSGPLSVVALRIFDQLRSPHDALDTPISQLQYGALNPSDSWAARRRELIAGTIETDAAA